MSFLTEKYPSFFKYFNTNYVPHVKQWGTCYRVGTVVNTNMFTESFHRLLKVVYLNNKQNRRVDRLIHVLLRIARNLVYEQLQKVEKGKMTPKYMRHKAAIELEKQSIQVVQYQENVWRIDNKGNQYTLKILRK